MTTLTKIKIGAIVLGIFLLFPGFNFFASLISGTSDLGVGMGFAGMMVLVGFVIWMAEMIVEVVETHIHKEKV